MFVLDRLGSVRWLLRRYSSVSHRSDTHFYILFNHYSQYNNQALGWKYGIRFPTEVKNLYNFHRARTGCGVHLLFHPLGIMRPFAGDKAGTSLPTTVYFEARLQSFEKRLLASSCLSVRPHRTTRLPMDGFSRNLIFECFFLNLPENSSCIKFSHE
jgi:hypothetical protein